MATNALNDRSHTGSFRRGPKPLVTDTDAISLSEAALYVRAAGEELARARNTLEGVAIASIRGEIDEAWTDLNRLARHIEAAS